MQEERIIHIQRLFDVRLAGAALPWWEDRIVMPCHIASQHRWLYHIWEIPWFWLFVSGERGSHRVLATWSLGACSPQLEGFLDVDRRVRHFAINYVIEAWTCRFERIGMRHHLFVNTIPVICIEYAPLLSFLLTFLFLHQLNTWTLWQVWHIQMATWFTDMINPFKPPAILPFLVYIGWSYVNLSTHSMVLL